MEQANLPALIDRAARRLAEARTSAEVLEARAAAQAALHSAKITKAANETQADCLRMIVRAEIRMADEVDRAQDSGQLQKHGYVDGEVQTPDLTSIGVDKRRLSEWRELRDAGEETVTQTIDNALLEGRVPTKTEILNSTRAPFVSNNSGNNEWYTPPEYIEAARSVMGSIDLDPASCDVANRIVKASQFYSIEDDGLTKDWSGNVWMNPPYAANLVDRFIHKLLGHIGLDKVSQAIVLVNNATETRWFQEILKECNAVCFVKSRIAFLNPDGEAEGKPLQGQAVLYFGTQRERFHEFFLPFGVTLNG